METERVSYREAAYRRRWSEIRMREMRPEDASTDALHPWNAPEWMRRMNIVPMADVGAKAREIIRAREARRAYL